ncbi:hypothetical protein Poli38472_013810 [Pythium oligandrum]|uniref:Uncharacterized protein n=1 Tax=Pythium oligandrum TaxID=41045 RepID=A0A8K1FDN4_PYTOL|nr:hypothetical protein Poli38472_013810 [Pythium oligandrum]|eukprot:TMW55048.1 hypothetical protein Poli38472_013810 [Pythium oligandrum]
MSSQCQGYVKDRNTGVVRQCGWRIQGYCHHHRDQCRGNRVNSKVHCLKKAKPGCNFCCAAHDPSIPYASPDVFGVKDLRRDKRDGILEQWDKIDPYHNKPLPLREPSAMQLDHITEKQLFSLASTRIQLQDHGLLNLKEELEKATETIREEIANEDKNLCFTLTTTNKIKGAACTNFINDTLMGRPVLTFTDYMMAGHEGDLVLEPVKLKRSNTKRIRKTMGEATKFCQYKMSDQGESPIFERFAKEFQQLFVDMELIVE